MSKKNQDPFRYNNNKSIYTSAELVIMFFDVIGFTKSTTNEEMKDCIRGIEAAITDELFEDYNWNEKDEKNDLILIPTGDGYSFAFHPNIKNDETLDIVKKFYCRLIRKINFAVRVGIAKGACQIYSDQNEKSNVFGYGINLANRVMGLALENQILVHEELAKSILTQRNHNELHEVKGKSFEIKHGERIKVYNFYGCNEGIDFGNPEDPVDPISMDGGAD